MKTTGKRKSVFVLLAVIAALLMAIAIFCFSRNATTVYAEKYDSEQNYTFTLITDNDGNSSYKVALKPTLRNSITEAVVPGTYNGLPVTELAANAFMSCKKLTQVTLLESVTTIGANAFVNCPLLENVQMPGAKIIGDNAFAACPFVELYMHNKIETVGANILRNNSKTIYVQSAEEDLGEGWSSAWNSNRAGAVQYNTSPEEAVKYVPVHDEGGNVIGYDIDENQFVSAAGEDVVIYNAYRPDGSSEYFPVLNIRPNAFFGVTLNSLTIKDRPDDDENFPVFNHKINIRSNAFYLAFIDSINIETDVTFNAFLQEDPCDADGHSIGVFDSSSIISVTLPASLDAVYESMFSQCLYLNEIRIAGQEYDGTNRLPNVVAIGDYAFNGCAELHNITIPSTVMKMGSSVFNEWGTSTNPNGGGKIQQEINIEFFKKKLPGGWSEDWMDGIDPDNVKINYLEILGYIDPCNGTNIIQISLVPGDPMPKIEVLPTFIGHTFKGIFSKRDGNGVQYYTSDGASARNWQEGDPTVFYAHWEQREYIVKLKRDGGDYIVRPKFGDDMPAASMPTKRGYDFKGYYYPESNGTKTFYYNADMSSARVWNRDEDCTLLPEWKPIIYKITYENVLDGINPNTIETYTIETPTIVFEKPYGRKGREGNWNIEQITKGSIGDITVRAEWQLIEYEIEYVGIGKGINPNTIDKYTIESDTIVFEKPYGIDGYEGSLYPTSIPHGSIGKVTVEISWGVIHYGITYANLLGGINPNQDNIYTIEDETIVFKYPYGRDGYLGNWDIPTIPKGSTGDIVVTALWTPILYKIKYVIDEQYINPNSHIETYTIESETINFAPPYGRAHYTGAWNITSIPKGSTGDITITAIWTPIWYKITYVGVNGLDNSNPNYITYDDVVTLNYVYKPDYMLVGWKWNGYYVNILCEIESNITLVAVWSDGKTVNLETSIPKLIVSAQDMTIVLPSANFTARYGCCIEVKAFVGNLTIKSNTNIVYKMNIDMSSRQSDMGLYLNKVSMQSAKPSTPAICLFGFYLNLYTTGTCVINGFNGSERRSSWDDVDASVGIECSKLCIYKADNLTIRGGNGCNAGIYGLSGTVGKYAVNASISISVATKNVKLIGGNGGNGMAGSTSYGWGAEATNIKVTGSQSSSTTIIKGSNGVTSG